MNLAATALVVSVVVAVGLGWYTARLDDQKKAVASALALIVVLIGGGIALHFDIATLEADQSSLLGRAIPTIQSSLWSSVVRDIADYDKNNSISPLQETLNEPLRRVISRSLYQAREGNIEIQDKNEVVVTAVKLLDQAQNSILATSYIDPAEWWRAGMATTYDAHLKTAKTRVKTFERLFIVDTSDELAKLKPVMESQQKSGIEVRYICASSLPSSQREDFIIVDSSVAGQLELDPQRKFKTGRFFSSKVTADDFERRFNALWIAGTSPLSAKEAKCSLSAGK